MLVTFLQLLRLPPTPKKKSSPLQKELEYPEIHWTQIFDKDVQTAILIYNDRVNTYRAMKVLDQEFDSHPKDVKVMKMVELRNQNLQCFKELKHFNDTGKWLYIHPLIIHQSEYNQLVALRRKDPQEFLRQYVATDGNVKRYTSYVKSPSREPKRKTDKLHLQAHIDRANIFKSILENEDPH